MIHINVDCVHVAIMLSLIIDVVCDNKLYDVNISSYLC